jgi:predicted ribonuclease YlaK
MFMSKHRNKPKRPYTGGPSRQQIRARQQERELLDAQQGYTEESDEQTAESTEDDYAEIAEQIGKNLEKKPVKWYVLDTNLILSCVDVLYDAEDDDWQEPINFRPKLDNAHLIIPQTVKDELNNIKKETSFRGIAARKALKRLSKLIPNSERTLDDIMNLRSPIETGWKNQTISILPLHKQFSKILPWTPGKDDNDGWIVITALAATLIREGYKVDGSLCSDEKFDIMKRSNEGNDVILLTNDNDMLSKADSYAVRTRSYTFEKRPMFTGCRELIVPAAMFKKFYHEDKLTREDFEAYLPDEPPLVANEYIIMNLEDERDLPRGYFTDGIQFKNIARYNKKNDTLYPMRFHKHEGITPANPGIATYYDAMNDDKIQVVNVTGLAGTGKTYQAIVHAIKEVRAGHYIQVVLIPSKSAKNPLGALPGNKEQKMEPLVAIAKGAIRSYLASTPEFSRKRELLLKHGDVEDDSEDEIETKGKSRKDNNIHNRENRRTRGSYTGSFEDLDYEYDGMTVKDYGDEGHSKKKKNKTFYPSKSDKKNAEESTKMTYRAALEDRVNYIYSRYFVCIPYEEAQGDSFEDSIVIIDEAQRIKVDDADTLLSRPAKRSKMFVMGDISQIHDSTPEKQLSNALIYSRMLFGDWEGCANVYLTDNMRSDIAEVMTRNRDKVRRMMGII